MTTLATAMDFPPPRSWQRGQRLGQLTVVERAGSGRQGVVWRLRCDCGDEVLRPASQLAYAGRRGRVLRCRACGMRARRTGIAAPTWQRGHRLGRLTVLERVASRRSGSRWRLRCDCGAEIERTATSLKRALREGRQPMCPACMGSLGGGFRARGMKNAYFRRLWDECGTLYAVADELQMEEDIRTALGVAMGFVPRLELPARRYRADPCSGAPHREDPDGAFGRRSPRMERGWCADDGEDEEESPSASVDLSAPLPTGSERAEIVRAAVERARARKRMQVERERTQKLIHIVTPLFGRDYLLRHGDVVRIETVGDQLLRSVLRSPLLRDLSRDGSEAERTCRRLLAGCLQQMRSYERWWGRYLDYDGPPADYRAGLERARRYLEQDREATAAMRTLVMEHVRYVAAHGLLSYLATSVVERQRQGENR